MIGHTTNENSTGDTGPGDLDQSPMGHRTISNPRPERSRRVQSPFLGQLLALIILAGALVLLPACGERAMLTRPRQMPGGNAQQGRQALLDYGCHSCHTIPGVPGADATVGPPLYDWAERHYIAGRLPNTAENLLLFVQFPQTVAPGIAMPDMDVTEQDARDIGAYLYTLRRSAWQEIWR